MDRVRDINLLDFCEKKLNKTKLLDREAILSLILSPDVSCVDNPTYMNLISTLGNITPWFQEVHPKIVDILTIGNGNISICGLGALSPSFDVEGIQNFDLYIHSCTPQEADILIQKCISTLDNVQYYLEEHCISINLNTYYLHEDFFDMFGEFTIRIFLEVYNSREQILANNYPITDKHVWDPINGYGCTKATAMLLIKNIIRLVNYEKDQAEQAIKEVDIIPIYAFHYYFEGNGYEEYFFEVEEQVIISVRNRRQDPSWSNILPNISTKLFSGYSKKLCYDFLDHDIVFAGVTDDVYVVLSNIKRMYNLNDDVFVILCDYLLLEEAKLAEERLLAS